MALHGARFPPHTLFDWAALYYAMFGTIGCLALIGYTAYVIWKSK